MCKIIIQKMCVNITCGDYGGSRVCVRGGFVHDANEVLVLMERSLLTEGRGLGGVSHYLCWQGSCQGQEASWSLVDGVRHSQLTPAEIG